MSRTRPKNSGECKSSTCAAVSASADSEALRSKDRSTRRLASAAVRPSAPRTTWVFAPRKSAANTTALTGSAQATANAAVEVITPQLSLTKGVSKAVAIPGETIRFTYVVGNPGTEDLADVALTDDVMGAVGTILQHAASGDS